MKSDCIDVRIFLLFIWCLPCYVCAETITVLGGRSSEPYIYAEGGYGFEVIIVQEALRNAGYDTEFILQPLGRAKITYEESGADALMTINNNYPEVQGSYLSAPYIIYRNVVVSLKERNFTVNSLSDLSDKSVIAFQKASVALGDSFANAVIANEKYWEMNEQNRQVAMLFLGRVDLIVLDHQIFKYYRKRLQFEDKNKPVVYHELFVPNQYQMAFIDKRARDDFDVAIQSLKASGRYQEIIDAYMGE